MPLHQTAISFLQRSTFLETFLRTTDCWSLILLRAQTKSTRVEATLSHMAFQLKAPRPIRDVLKDRPVASARNMGSQSLPDLFIQSPDLKVIKNIKSTTENSEISSALALQPKPWRRRGANGHGISSVGSQFHPSAPRAHEIT